ncbi:hypothetical protein D1872_275780 [compost metagenome]
MQLVGTDAHFRTETELPAIGKLCRSVDIDACGIDSVHKLLARRVVFRNDRFGVA